MIDSKGALRFEIKGKWDAELKALPVSTVKSIFLSKPIQLWKRNEMPQGSKDNFEFGYISLRLNQLLPELAKILPSSDARVRPDQRALEEGRWSDANECKETLERRQKEERKSIVQNFEDHGLPNGPPNRTGIAIGEEWWVPRFFERRIDGRLRVLIV